MKPNLCVGIDCQVKDKTTEGRRVDPDRVLALFRHPLPTNL